MSSIQPANTIGAFWTLNELCHHGVRGAAVPHSNLNGAVHSLFKFRPGEIMHVTELAPDDQGELQPVEADPISVLEWDFFLLAFRLATHFITHDQFLDWWIVLVHGSVELPGLDGSANPLLSYPAGDRNYLRQSTLQALEELSQHLNVSFRDSADVSWGATWPLRTGVEIELHNGFLHFARQALRQQAHRSGTYLPFETDGSQVAEIPISSEHFLRVQWMMAIALCHELSHAVWHWRNPDRDDYPLAEPNHCMDPRTAPTPELGMAWTYWLLGFAPNDIPDGYIVDFARGLRVAPSEIFANGVLASFDGMDWPVPGFYQVWSPIPSKYIASWFREETWAGLQAGRAPNLRAFVQLTPLAVILGPGLQYLGRVGATVGVMEHSSLANQ